MDGLDQIEAFGIELEKLIGRFHAEFEVPPAAMDDEDGLWDG